MASKKETKAQYQHYVPAVKKVPDWYKNFNFVLITSMEELRNAFKGYEDGKYFMGFDTETTGLNFEELELVGYSFCLDGKTSYYVPVYHFEYEHNLGEPAVEFIYDRMCHAKMVFLFNMRYDFRVFEFRGYKEHKKELDNKRYKYVKYDMSKVPYYDVCVACWNADTNKKMPSLKFSSEHFLGFEQMHFDEVINEAGNFFYLNPSENPDVTYYAAADALCTYLLVPVTMKYFQEGRIATKADNAVLYPLMHFEEEKIWVDTDKVRAMLNECKEEVEVLEKNVYDMLGTAINLNSPIQVAQAFQRIGIDTGEKTESGGMATGMKVLEKLPDAVKEQFPALKSYIEYKETYKLMSSYFKVLNKECERTGGYTRFAYQTSNVPCLTENNYVFIKGKGLISIKNVVEGDFIWTQYGYRRVTWNHSHISDDVYRITFMDGTTLEGTGHHPVLVNGGKRRDNIKPIWVEIGDIKINERVIKNSHPVESDATEIKFPRFHWNARNPLRKKVTLPDRMTLKLARFIGYMDGDGCVMDDRVRLSFNTKEPEVIQYYVSLFEELFQGIGKPNIGVDGNSTTYDYFSKFVVGFFHFINVREVRYKGISSYIKKSGPEFWVEYLKGLWDTDGCLAKSGTVGKIFQPRVKTVKKNLMEDVFNLIKGISIDASFHERVAKAKNNKNQYEITIINPRGLVYFDDFIGKYLVNNKRRERSSFNRNYVEKYYDLNQTIFKGKIEKIEPSVVYDIEVEDVHEYVANGIVTHNTGRLSAGKDAKNTYFTPMNIQAFPKPHVLMYDVFFTGDRNLNVKKDNILLGYKFVPAQYDDNKNHIVPTDSSYVGMAEGMNPRLNVRSCMTAKMFKDSDEDEFIYGAADYAAQELRITANLSREPVWSDAFIHGRDVHKSCYSMDTEILTKDGWKNCDDIEYDTLIAQYNEYEQKVEWVPAGHKYFNESMEMYHFTGHNTDLLVTPNHRMFASTSGNKVKNWYIYRADELYKKSRFNIICSPEIPVEENKAGIVEIDPSYHKDGFTIDIKDFAELLGYVIADGGTCLRCGGQKEVYFSQSEVKPYVLKKMENLNKRLGNLFNEDVEYCKGRKGKILGKDYTCNGNFHRFSLVSAKLYDSIIDKIGGPLKKDRKLSNWVKNLPDDVVKVFLQAMIDGDGSPNSDKTLKDANSFYLIIPSKELADDVQLLFIRIGYSTNMRDVTFDNGTICKHLNVRKSRRVVSVDNSKSEVVKYNKPVKSFCFAVPTGLLVVRRNGKVSVCGNTAIALWGEENYNKDYRKRAKGCFSTDDFFYTNHGAVRGKYLDIINDTLIDLSGNEQRFNYFLNKQKGYEFELSNGVVIHTTKDHKFNVIDTFEEGQYVTADNLEVGRSLGLVGMSVFGDYQKLTLKKDRKNKEKNIILDEGLAYVLGYYLGDGSVSISNTKGYFSVLAKDFNKDYIVEVLSRYGNPYIMRSDGKDYCVISISKKQFADMVVQNFGRKKDKRIGDVVYCSPKSVMMSFLAGMLDSDSKIDNSIEYQSTLRELSEDFSRLATFLGYTVISFNKEKAVLKAKYRNNSNKDYKTEYYIVRVAYEESVNDVPILSLRSKGNLSIRKRSSVYYNILEEDRSKFKGNALYSVIGNFTDGRSRRLSRDVSRASGDWRYKYIPVTVVRKEEKEIEVVNLECETHKFVCDGLEAPNCNFGIIYGMSASSLIDPKYGIHTLAQAEEFYNHYKSSLPTLFQWIDRTQRSARRRGTTYTYFGRPRRLKGYYDMHNNGFANRTATNTQVQGTAGDMLKLVMIRLWKNLLNNPEYRDDVAFRCTIHDEIQYSIRASRAHEILNLIEKNQTVVLKEWPIPIITEASVGWNMGSLFAFQKVEDDSELGFHYEPKLE